MKRTSTERVWRVRRPDRPRMMELAQALDIPPLVAHLLIIRGIADAEAADRFLNPRIEHLGDPLSLPDMGAAVGRLRRARDHGERVLVFGDYDVDGITGSAVLAPALRRFGIRDCDVSMPNRLTEGYGLGVEHVRSARDSGVRLIVTVDNGIGAKAGAAAAQELGIDLIITDHHEPEPPLPHAVARVNPRLGDTSHPSAQLTGAGVAFKLAQALTGSAEDLDLAALGTVADVAPLTGENRALVALGLRDAAQRARPGLIELSRVAKLDLNALTTQDIAFQLGPRINAGGRLGKPLAGYELLLTESAGEARRIASELDAANEERREIEGRIVEDALRELMASFRPEQRTITLARRDWHSGVVGIVASRLQSYYYRPVVLIALDDDGVGHGSVRSVDGFDVAAALSACAQHLMKFGGHPAAAGLTIREDRLEAFREEFEAVASRSLPEGDLTPPFPIDAQISLNHIDGRILRLLDRLEPFGQSNPAPVFCVYNVEVPPHSLRELKGGHLRLSVRQDAAALPAIGFRMADRLAEIQEAARVDIAFSPQFNTWRGETTIQLVLKDIRPAGTGRRVSCDAP